MQAQLVGKVLIQSECEYDDLGNCRKTEKERQTGITIMPSSILYTSHSLRELRLGLPKTPN